MDSASVDDLLERYLALLDEYTTVRATLNSLQSAMYHSLARANFAAERGMRYGPDHFDGRMQALRRVHISSAGPGNTTFRVALLHDDDESLSSRETHESYEGKGQGDEHQEERKPTSRPAAKDPLRWFGLLAPNSLRLAQGQAVQAVEQAIPRLASLDAEMADLEIQVRRARKRRAKAEAVEKKQSHSEQSREGVTAIS